MTTVFGLRQRPAATPLPTGPVPGTPAIHAVGVRKTYLDVEAVRGVDLTIAQGETFGLLGPNGTGKPDTEL